MMTTCGNILKDAKKVKFSLEILQGDYQNNLNKLNEQINQNSTDNIEANLEIIETESKRETIEKRLESVGIASDEVNILIAFQKYMEMINFDESNSLPNMKQLETINRELKETLTEYITKHQEGKKQLTKIIEKTNEYKQLYETLTNKPTPEITFCYEEHDLPFSDGEDNDDYGSNFNCAMLNATINRTGITTNVSEKIEKREEPIKDLLILNNFSILKVIKQHISDNNLSAALSLCKNVLENTKNSNNKSETEVACIASITAKVLIGQQKYSEAVTLLNETLSSQEKVLGEKNVHLLPILNTILACYYKMGTFSLGGNICEKAGAICQAFKSTHPIEVAKQLTNIGTFLSKLGNYNESVSNYRKALEIYQSPKNKLLTVNVNAKKLLQTKITLSLLLIKQSKFLEAEITVKDIINELDTVEKQTIGNYRTSSAWMTLEATRWKTVDEGFAQLMEKHGTINNAALIRAMEYLTQIYINTNRTMYSSIIQKWLEESKKPKTIPRKSLQKLSKPPQHWSSNSQLATGTESLLRAASLDRSIDKSVTSLIPVFNNQNRQNFIKTSKLKQSGHEVSNFSEQSIRNIMKQHSGAQKSLMLDSHLAHYSMQTVNKSSSKVQDKI